MVRQGEKFTTAMVEQLGFQLFVYEKQYNEATLEDVCRMISTRFNQRFDSQWSCAITNGQHGWWMDHEPGYYMAIQVQFRWGGHHLVLWRTKPQGGLNSTTAE